jgi:hypothetical protein
MSMAPATLSGCSPPRYGSPHRLPRRRHALLEVVGQDAQHLAGIELDTNLAYRVVKGIVPALGRTWRQMADAVREDDALLSERLNGGFRSDVVSTC